jgi:hypothetical protein
VVAGPANDVHVLNSKTRTWTDLTGVLNARSAQPPPARRNMGFATGPGGIWMFGGIEKKGQTLSCYCVCYYYSA